MNAAQAPRRRSLAVTGRRAIRAIHEKNLHDRRPLDFSSRTIGDDLDRSRNLRKIFL
jgi:hypothetical protein